MENFTVGKFMSKIEIFITCYRKLAIHGVCWKIATSYRAYFF